MQFDSSEELHFSWILQELKDNRFVNSFTRDVPPFILSDELKESYEEVKIMKTKTKIIQKERIILHGHIYTPDFLVDWATDKPGFNNFFSKNLSSYIEIKPLWDQNNMTRLFVINQKWVYSKYGIIVYKVIPEKFMQEFFTPRRFLMTDKGKQLRKIKWQPRTLEQFLETKK